MKFRTDFVTNSSSSSFIAVVGVTLTNGEYIEWESSPYCDEDNGSLNITMDVVSLCNAKSIEELIEMLKNGITVETGCTRNAITKQSCLIKSLYRLKSMEDIESITVGGREYFHYNEYWFRYYICNRATKEIKAAFEGDDMESIDGGRSEMYENYVDVDVVEGDDNLAIMYGGYRFKNSDAPDSLIDEKPTEDLRRARIFISVKDICQWKKLEGKALNLDNIMSTRGLFCDHASLDYKIVDINYISFEQFRHAVNEIRSGLGVDSCVILADWTDKDGLPVYELLFALENKIVQKTVYEDMSSVDISDAVGWLNRAGINITENRLRYLSSFPSDKLCALVKNEKDFSRKCADLEAFSDMFDSKVVGRGGKIYKDGNIKNLQKTDEGYTANVQGSEIYKVSVITKGKPIPKMTCTCPFESKGKKCKHIYAALLAIEDLDDTAFQYTARVNAPGFGSGTTFGKGFDEYEF